MSLQPIRFNKNQQDFVKVLKQRVNDYFDKNNISKFANGKMYFKTFCLVSLYVVPLVLMLTGVVNTGWGVYFMWVIMGFGVAGIGLGVMHDANHGSYSNHKIINNILGGLLNMVGGNAANWRMQHNVLHHTYTNITGYDDDINPGGLLRFTPHVPRKKMHKYQHYYAWFLYGLMTMTWIFHKEFVQVFRFDKMGITKSEGGVSKLIAQLVVTKLVYYTVMIFLPLYLIEVPVGYIIAGFFTMHYLAGFFLGIVFQPAHVVPTSEYPMPDVDLTVEHNWFVHQLYTTSNFAKKNKILSWYVGGLNFQVEHHLFPNICHVHYPDIAPIVKQTALEFGLPYHEMGTFGTAIAEHAKTLKELGQNDNHVVAAA